MATKVNIKRSMASHRTYVNNAIKRAEKFIADHPNGLTNSHAHKTATAPAKLSYQKIYVPSKWLLNFDKYGYGGHVDVK